MKASTAAAAALFLPLVFAIAPARAASGAEGTGHAAAAATEIPAIDVLAEPAVAVVDAFGRALAAGDLAAAAEWLDPAVVILESGGAERSRDEYLGHHGPADAAFLAGAHTTLTHRTARSDGDTAWVASESELRKDGDGKPLHLLSTETMVLRHTPAGWKIVHIHWSSRPKNDDA